MNDPIAFQPHHILCLEHETTCLYAEVIQVTPRGRCWVRPLVLVSGSADPQVTFHDLSQGADLLCPHSLFRLALDTEVIPVLAQLNRLKAQLEAENTDHLEGDSLARQRLQEFINQVWQAHPDAFQL